MVFTYGPSHPGFNCKLKLCSLGQRLWGKGFGAKALGNHTMKESKSIPAGEAQPQVLQPGRQQRRQTGQESPGSEVSVIPSVRCQLITLMENERTPSSAVMSS